MNLKNILTLNALIALTTGLFAQTPKYHVIVGTYTDKGSKGIYVYEYNTQTGHMTLKNSVAASNPSYLTISPDRKFVYAVNEDVKGGVTAYKYNSALGQLTLLNKVSSGGVEPCYVSTDPTGKFVFVANYTSGSLSALAVNADGSLGATQTIKHSGPMGPDKVHQEAPHVHSIMTTPDDQYVMTANLGTDKINIYKFDPKNVKAPLSPASTPFIAIKPGSGPRHLLFHQNKKFAYLVSELGATVTAFTYANGKLTTTQTITMIDKGYKGAVSAADVHISPDGKFLYASDRDDVHDLVIYTIDQTTGKLTFLARTPSLGKHPRNFAIDPAGNFLLVANRDTDDIVVFKRNAKTGLLTPTGEKIKLSHPVCIKFVQD